VAPGAPSSLQTGMFSRLGSVHFVARVARFARLGAGEAPRLVGRMAKHEVGAAARHPAATRASGTSTVPNVVTLPPLIR
jgi:hypothetical protein